MSKRRARPTLPPAALLRRRAALGVHVALEAAVLVGAQGPWWEVWLGASRTFVQLGYDPARTGAALDPWAAAAGLAALVAFFFASYDLVADDDLQAPILLASVVVLVVAARLLYTVAVDAHTVERVLDEVRAAGDIAAVATSGAPSPAERLTPVLKTRWGLALVVAAAPLLVLVSVYLTFFAQRAPEPS
jgi:hypothetical protein